MIWERQVLIYTGCFWAAQTALKIQNRTNQGTEFLMSLLDTLEEASCIAWLTVYGLTTLQMKALLGGNEAVTNEAAGSAYVENFALKIFMGADNDDRGGAAGK
jgi:vacuolar protein sorting-associated protein VTA1